MDHCKIFNCNNRWISSMLTLAWVKLNQLKTGRSDSVGPDPQINGLLVQNTFTEIMAFNHKSRGIYGAQIVPKQFW